MIDWKPNKTSTVSLYKQIIEFIKKKIADGEWDIGTKLPSQRELAKIFEVNRSTIVEALDELKAEGLIEGKGSGGTKIINNTWSLLASTPPPNWGDYIDGGIYRPNLATIQAINRLEFEPDMIRLGTGELSPELLPNTKMKKILEDICKKSFHLGYEEPKGNLFLRKVVSEYLKKYEIHASPDSILIVSGSLQALQLISIGILQPGSTVLVEKPSYLKSLHVFQSAGMNLKGISLDDDGIKPMEIHKSYNTQLLYTIPTFHNPTGRVMPPSRRKEVLNVCEKERLPIIEDDVYRELWIDEPPPRPLKAHDKNGNVLYLGSVSKSLAPGLRIGWLVGARRVIERLGDIKMQVDYGSSSLSQWAVAEWISSGLYEEHLSEVRKQLKMRREVALQSLEKYFSDRASWKRPPGGFYIWLKLRKEIDMNKLFAMAWREGILINPGNIYDFSKNPHIRISYSYASCADLEKGLKKLSQLIEEVT